MDKDTRNAIERAAQRARRALEEDFYAQLAGTFDVQASGEVADSGGAHLSAEQSFRRDKIVAAIEHKGASGMKPGAAVADFVRDAAFTTLNRFVALKLLETRDLVQECITKGERSSGFGEFGGMAPGVALLPDGAGYQLYLESLFDELSTGVKVLFDRRDAASLVSPKRATFETLLEILNGEELSGVWAEDETIGWFYQFFNSGDERKKMRDESSAPRNSRELAVRNQFFTPRYVVQFLTDNTLGRTWFEMRNEKTALAEQCEYLVRPVDEPTQSREMKDPRDLRILDPACGSGHFLLYCFDLLLTIYEEAWEAGASVPASQTTGHTLQEDYPKLETLRQAVPALILEHNLYGVDIDPRCAQIAALALWLRAQRVYKELGIAPGERRAIHGTHIVVAEPMPGDETMVKEFAAQLNPPLLCGLFQKMVGEMRLAGDLGTLLRVEDGIATEIGKAREQFVKQREETAFLPGMETERRQGDLDLSGIDDERFFHEAESTIVTALREYAESAVGGAHVRRRLFAGDAAQGIALIDIARTFFDVVLMNPPFGAPSADMARSYPDCKEDIDAAFVMRATQMLEEGGRLGALVNRTQFAKATLEDWRRKVLIGEWCIHDCADLGLGVLDGALVETAAYCLECRSNRDLASFFRLSTSADREADLRRAIRQPSFGKDSRRVRIDPRALGALPLARISYWISPELRDAFVSFPPLEGNVATARQGTITSDNFRFLRATWEVPERRIAGGADETFRGRVWVPLAKGGEYSPYFQDVHLAIQWERDGYEIKNFVDKDGKQKSRPQGLEFNFKRALTYSERTASNLSVRIGPPGCFYSQVGPVIATYSQDSVRPLLGVLMSRVVAYLIELSAESVGAVTRGGAARHYTQGILGNLPIPDLAGADADTIGSLVEAIWHEYAADEQLRETSLYFIGPFLDSGGDLGRDLPAVAESRYRAKEERWLRIIGLSWSVEKRVRSLFGIHEIAAAEIDREVGRHPGSYTGTPVLDAAFSTLLLGPLKAVIDSIVSRDGATRSATKMCFFADRRLELLCQYFDSAPSHLVEARRESGALPDGFLAEVAHDILSYFLGVALGRWTPDCVVGRDASLPSDTDPLPSFSSGSNLSGAAVLVDDEGHPADIVAAIERSAREAGGADLNRILEECVQVVQGGAGGIRTWIRQGAFNSHLSRYTASRRKAPIYWNLATPSAQYSVWLSAHRLTRDSFFQIQNDVVVPKLAHEERKLASLVQDAGGSPSAKERKEIAAQESFVEELRAMLEEVKRVAPLWNPNRDDGVVLTMAPLWRLVPQHKEWQKELRSRWDELCAGKYDWAHVAMHLWPDRVVLQCANDRSLAIAHGLEDVFWAEGDDGKWAARSEPIRPVGELMKERTSSAVQAALASLLAAPVAGASGRGRRKGARAASARGNR